MPERKPSAAKPVLVPELTEEERRADIRRILARSRRRIIEDRLREARASQQHRPAS